MTTVGASKRQCRNVGDGAASTQSRKKKNQTEEKWSKIVSIDCGSPTRTIHSTSCTTLNLDTSVVATTLLLESSPFQITTLPLPFRSRLQVLTRSQRLAASCCAESSHRRRRTTSRHTSRPEVAALSEETRHTPTKYAIVPSSWRPETSQPRIEFADENQTNERTNERR